MYKLGGNSRTVCLAVVEHVLHGLQKASVRHFLKKTPFNAHATNSTNEAEKDNEFLTLSCNMSHFRFGRFFFFFFLKLSIGYSAEINVILLLSGILGDVCV